MNLRNKERLHALLPSATMVVFAIVATIWAVALVSAQVLPYSEASQAPLASPTPCASGDLAHSVAATSPGPLSVRDIDGSEPPAANLNTAASAPGLDGALMAPSADDQSGLTLEQVKQAVNTRGARWQAGETSVSGLSFDQKTKLCGLLSSPEADAAPLLTAPKGFVPYGTFDWRNKDGFDWMTPVKDQGPCGTCWVYGTIASLEAVINIELNNPDIDPDLSEQQVLSCNLNNPTCCGGWPNHAYSFLASNGVADEGCFPYNCPEYGCSCAGTACNPCADWATTAWKISGWTQVAMTTASLKWSLQKYGPLGIAMKAPDDFMFYESGVYEPVLESGRWSSMFPLGQANHWVTLVGYNDIEGYWIVKNSWGADWGEDGYGRIAYGVLEQYYAYALWGATGPVAPPVTTPTPNPTPTPTPVASPTPKPSVVFSDSFEGCLTNWVQDSQNDWYCYTRRASDGTRSAEVDGTATDATITLKNAINLSTTSQATLIFSWYIQKEVDSGEYVALDLWNGTGWEEAARLRGDIDAEDVWHNESIDLSGHLISDFKLRFRATVSSSKERGNVDLVQIAGTLPPQPTPTPTPTPAPTPTTTPTPGPTPTPTPNAAFWAVIVGVADYPGKANDLNYSDDDARDVRNALLAGTNWDAGHMRVLIDTQATRANIRSAINWMVSSGGAGDAFFFFFSGHGTTVVDQPPIDEADGYDEALCQYDFQTTGPIRDDELGTWLAALPGSPVMVAIDTCFSGGMVKADGVTGRGLLGAGRPDRSDGFVADLDDSVNGVVLTACDEDEVSWEIRSLRNGLFTYYFVAGLYGPADNGGNGDKTVSMEEAFDYLYPPVVGYPVSPKQYPQQYDSWTGEAPLVVLAQPTPTPSPTPIPTPTPTPSSTPSRR